MAPSVPNFASARLNASRMGILRSVSRAQSAHPPARRTSLGFTSQASPTASWICFLSLRHASMQAFPSMNVTREE